MKIFTILESFGPAQGDVWNSYIAWRGLSLERFDSIDGILRPRLFTPVSNEGWEHVSEESGAGYGIIDYEYAVRMRTRMGRGDIVGMRWHAHDESDSTFLGYDLIDSYFDVSLLTNWGNDNLFINEARGVGGLIQRLDVAERIQSHLLSSYAEDDHVDGCHIVSIYGNAAE